MKSRRLMMVSWLVVAIMIVTTLSMFGCKGAPTPGEQKTLKIGVTAFFGWPPGLDFVHGLDIIADTENEKGGIDIGGEKYKVEFIVYDSNMDVTTETAAVNRLVFEDKVKFILTDGTNVVAWLDITEQNKVLVLTGTPAPDVLNPDLNYTFNAAPQNCTVPVILGWVCKNFPDIKSIALVLPDNQIGHVYNDVNARVFQAFGLSSESIFYPADSQDLSAIGTKVKTLNLDSFFAQGGGPILDGLALKAAWQAGYEGQYLYCSTAPYLTLSQVVPPEALEGLIGGAWAVEFDPPLTDQAKEFKDAWIVKYGKWEGPEIIMVPTWSCLRTALQQAKSLDVDKVATVIGSGLKYESPTGLVQVVSRPDMGNDKTIDAVAAFYIKQVVGGEVVLIHSTTLEEAVSLFKEVYK